MSKCALPSKMIRDPKGNMVNLQDALHWDWPWPMSYLPRSANAKGPRCPIGPQCPHGGYKQWPPKLVEGYGVTRWETAGATSIINIPGLDGEVRGSDVYGKTLAAVEESPVPGRQLLVKLEYKVQRYDHDGNISFPELYSPSAIQRSPQGYLVFDPGYRAWWKTGSYFARWGWRPDHLDVYYNWGPYAGVNTE